MLQKKLSRFVQKISLFQKKVLSLQDIISLELNFKHTIVQFFILVSPLFLKAEQDSLYLAPSVSRLIGANVICEGTSTTLSVNPSSVKYIWKVGNRPEDTTTDTFVHINATDFGTAETKVPVSVRSIDAGTTVYDTVYITTKPEILTRVNDTFCPEDTARAAMIGIITSTDCYFKWLDYGATTDTINDWWEGMPVDTTFRVRISRHPLEQIGYENACYIEDSAKIVVVRELGFSITGETVVCVGDTVSLTVTGAHDITWNPGDYTDATAFFEIVSAGNNAFTVNAKDARGCRGNKSHIVEGLPTPTDARIFVNGIEDSEADICRGEGAEISVLGGNGWFWTSSRDTTYFDTIYPRERTTYEVIVYADAARTQCSVKLEQTVDVRNCDIVYFPTAISLSSEIEIDDAICGGKRSNRIFKPIGRKQSFVQYYLAVFNRWGELLFESNDFCIGWNGTHQGEDVRPGTYIYIFRLTNKRDVWEKKGTVTVVD